MIIWFLRISWRFYLGELLFVSIFFWFSFRMLAVLTFFFFFPTVFLFFFLLSMCIWVSWLSFFIFRRYSPPWWLLILGKSASAHDPDGSDVYTLLPFELQWYMEACAAIPEKARNMKAAKSLIFMLVKWKDDDKTRIIPLLAGKYKHPARASLSLGKLFLDFSFNPFQFFLASQPSFFDLGKLCFDFCQIG